MILITIVNGVLKTPYNWGAPDCGYNEYSGCNGYNGCNGYSG
jgi:hypothetical protein